eukprot:gnl/TRDRNA2_/TRDRNA2_192239_c0_seq1.p1 gnl/TRDRNA2_/TRDRNA2_192239_c0~~gnl/TRDRNA2_/TRDRNA2_192239_c0_seq1.p1  ORF type:complete len:327 (-),score=59.04 gnl/TRDRNA2_/TRDRNA2_192239_c0_seq1:55-1035(-)
MAAPMSARSPVARSAQPVVESPLSARMKVRMRNPLLVRDDVGKARPTCYDLPEDGFAFGRANTKEEEGAGEVMRWRGADTNMPPSPERAVQDFQRLNKRALANRHCSAREQALFRREQAVDLPLLVAPESPRTQADIKPVKMLPSDIVPTWCYGHRARPSTPIKELISNKYGIMQEQELESFYDEVAVMRESDTANIRKIPLTRASRGHASPSKKATMRSLSQGEKDPFKMSKFKKIGPRVAFPNKTSELMRMAADPSVPETAWGAQLSDGDSVKEIMARAGMEGYAGGGGGEPSSIDSVAEIMAKSGITVPSHGALGKPAMATGS